MSDKTIQYDNIFYLSTDAKSSGKIKFASAGVGWKEGASGSVTTVKADDFKQLLWLRSARDFQVRIQAKGSHWYKFDGFPKEAFDELKDFARANYPAQLEVKELSLKGWNWGSVEIGSGVIEFQTNGKTMFDLVLSEITNAVITSKNELAVEVLQSDNTKKLDNLVEIRFHIPNVSPEGGLGEEEDAASVLCEQIKNSAELSESPGEIIASFPELPCLTPRGRYEVDMTATFMRFRGKSYDYKILYSSITRLFLLPKPDDVHILFVISLDPPIRQGQTRYPFIVMQFARDDAMEIDLALTDEQLENDYKDRLVKSYDAPTFEVVTSIFKGLTQKKVTVPGTFKSHHGFSAIKVSQKANEGFLYPLEKSFLFIPKPPIFIPHSEIGAVVLSRLDTGSSKSRTFDMKFSLKNGIEFAFSSISKEEFAILESYFADKNIKMKNELTTDDMPKQSAYLSDDNSDDGRILSDNESNDQEEESSEDEEYKEGMSDESDASGSATPSESESAMSESNEDEKPKSKKAKK